MTPHYWLHTYLLHTRSVHPPPPPPPQPRNHNQIMDMNLVFDSRHLLIPPLYSGMEGTRSEGKRVAAPLSRSAGTGHVVLCCVTTPTFKEAEAASGAS